MNDKEIKILFQGDSVTDVSRTDVKEENLGKGYPYLISTYLRATYPEKNIKVINRGISGHRTIDLVKRWDKDCVDIKADIVSILIGINDTWRRFDSDSETNAEQFEENYRKLLNAIPKNTKIILIEPFLLAVSDEQKTKWRADLNPKIDVIRKLAYEYKTELINMDGIFAKANVKASPTFWTADGVHPTIEGHTLISKEVIKVLEKII